MLRMLEIQVNVFMFFVLLIVSIHLHCRFKHMTAAEKVLQWIISLLSFLLLMEMGSVLVNGRAGGIYRPVNIVINLLGFVLMPYPILLYIEWLDKWINDERNPRRNRLWICSAIYDLSIIVGMSYQWFFSISAKNVYNRGPYFIFLSIYIWFLVAYTVADIAVHSKQLYRDERKVFALIVLLPGITAGLQLYFVHYLTIWSSCSLSVVILYLFWLSKRMSQDQLTQLENRRSYEAYKEEVMKKEPHVSLKLAVINFDIDDFKKINDCFGHQEGDQALSIFAKGLKQVFKRPNRVIRFGGDEFVVLAGEEEARVKKKVQAFEQVVNDYNKNSGKDYKIKFSYGVTIYDHQKETIEACMVRADELMYLQKKRKKEYLEKHDKHEEEKACCNLVKG